MQVSDSKHQLMKSRNLTFFTFYYPGAITGLETNEKQMEYRRCMLQIQPDRVLAPRHSGKQGNRSYFVVGQARRRRMRNPEIILSVACLLEYSLA